MEYILFVSIQKVNEEVFNKLLSEIKAMSDEFEGYKCINKK